MPGLLPIFTVLLASTLLAVWSGWGLARLALPPSLQPYKGMLAPLLGYSLVLVAGYYGVHDLASLPIVLMVLLPITGLFNMLAWRRTGPPRLPTDWWEYGPLALLLLVTLLVGVLPLLSYGYSGVIGEGWDVEAYFPLTRWLERAPYNLMASAPANVTWSISSERYTIGLTLGFSIWHGCVDLLSRVEALLSFAPVLAWLRALGVLAVYVLFRSTLGLRAPFALLGAALVSAGGLLLWVTLYNFGMQLSAWPLIPLGLVVGIAAVQDGVERGLAAWPSLLLAAVCLVAQPVAYYPALTVFIPLAVGL
ncbi:MAG: hypothetical protein M3014_01670, partial [Chloroflexota bacterium]|nr:hypothetical protein [Chloroflexota bacterium]